MSAGPGRELEHGVPRLRVDGVDQPPRDRHRVALERLARARPSGRRAPPSARGCRRGTPRVHRGPLSAARRSAARAHELARRACAAARRRSGSPSGTLKRREPVGAVGAQVGLRAASVAQHDGRHDGLAPLRVRRGRGRAASATAGWPSSTASTSAGATFSPPVTIVSDLRPTTCRHAVGVRRPEVAGREQPAAAAGRDGRAAHEDLAVLGERARRVQNSGAPSVVTCEHASVSP